MTQSRCADGVSYIKLHTSNAHNDFEHHTIIILSGVMDDSV